MEGTGVRHAAPIEDLAPAPTVTKLDSSVFNPHVGLRPVFEAPGNCARRIGLAEGEDERGLRAAAGDGRGNQRAGPSSSAAGRQMSSNRRITKYGGPHHRKLGEMWSGDTRK